MEGRKEREGKVRRVKERKGRRVLKRKGREEENKGWDEKGLEENGKMHLSNMYFVDWAIYKATCAADEMFSSLLNLILIDGESKSTLDVRSTRIHLFINPTDI